MSDVTASAPPPPARRGFGRRRASDEGPRASFRQLLPYLLEHRRVLVWVIVLSVLGAAASLAQPLLVNQVITRVQHASPLGWLVWALVGLVVVAGLLSGYQHYLLQRTGEGVVLSSRRRLVARLLNLPIAEFDQRRTGDLVSRVGADTTALRAVLTQGLIDAIGGALTFVGALVGMLIIDPVLLGLTVLVIAVSVVVVVLLSGRIRNASAQAQKKVGDLTAAVERAITSVRTIRAAGATAREVAAVDEDSRGAWQMGIQVARISAMVVPVAGIALQVSFLVVLGIGGYRVASGAISVASLVTFIIFLFMLVMPLGNAFGAITSVNSALGALGRIEEIIALPGEDARDAQTASLAQLRADAPAIAFDRVSFAYPVLPGEAESAPVLREVSFDVPRGKRTALVGPSGAGKSTSLALIERFYDPTAGAIRIGGVDVADLPRDELRAQLGYVEQDAPALAGSLRDNLRLAAPDASDDACRDVLEAVNLGEVLARSPLGLDAPVGEEGVMLSGGERQRLAIARALLAAPPILLLDESTSSLDGRNEQLMREAIDAVAEHRTMIVIAHRLSTVVDSDQIVVLDHGEVVGVGTHSELVASVPLYRELAKHQLLV
ncbi:ABC transporter ATP-binding protein [Gryllotalpicola protaetiae]|uniref:ABC transporter ATP-binding protein n=1 Tax=Gryllotalpicola protaetiae TaxID=2419771 RepID=A0A387BK41_9MICO|nr:ABC transporter ATP-binding protein [Gryllotalpicola protaetiae]AYG04223.1 ABC transporter ATP-binding protein [Gryllotalpicola protaetiae]